MDALRQRIADLWSERRRIGLVALGVAWGTLSVSLLLAVGNSMYAATSATIDNFGVDLLRINGGATTRSFGGLPSGRGIRLMVEDVERLSKGVPQARTVTLEYSSGSSNPIRNGKTVINAPLSGCSEVFRDLRGMRPEPGGRFLNAVDIEQHRRVLFLGNRLKHKLFGEQQAVGREVLLYDVPFTVIGVRQDLITVTNYNGRDADKAYLPHTTFRDLRGWTRVSFLWVGLSNPKVKQDALDAIRKTLGQHYHFDPADEDALDIQDYLALHDMIHGMLDGNRYFNAFVGVLGLLVSMLGVANVMFALIEERRGEIGLKMALGARPRDIGREHFEEGLLITFLGGSAGLLVCAALFLLLDLLPMGNEVRAYFGYPRLSLGLGAILVALLGLAGSIASWLPARRATRLDPILTLREE